MSTMPASSTVDRSQDLHDCLAEYRRQHPEDVMVVEERVSADQDVTALVWELAARGRGPVVWCNDVEGRGPLVTNLFASRPRIAHWLGADARQLHEAYQQRRPAGPADARGRDRARAGRGRARRRRRPHGPAPHHPLRVGPGALHHQRHHRRRGRRDRRGQPQLPPRRRAVTDHAGHQPALPWRPVAHARGRRRRVTPRCRWRWCSAPIRSSCWRRRPGCRSTSTSARSRVDSSARAWRWCGHRSTVFGSRPARSTSSRA